MPRKIYRKKKRVYRKKRKLYKKKKTLRKSMYSFNPQMMKIKRSFQLSAPINDVPGVITSGIQIEDPYVVSNDVAVTKATSYSFYGFIFHAGQVPGIADYAGLFDQYRISYIVLKFDYLSATGADMVYNNTNNPKMQVLWWTDYDDTSSPGTNLAGWQKVYESGRAKLLTFPNNGSNTFYVKFKPRILIPAIDTAGGLTARRSIPSPWMDGETTLNTIHYGIKMMFQANPSNPEIFHQFRVTATYYFQFKYRRLI